MCKILEPEKLTPYQLFSLNAELIHDSVISDFPTLYISIFFIEFALIINSGEEFEHK